MAEVFAYSVINRRENPDIADLHFCGNRGDSLSITRHQKRSSGLSSQGTSKGSGKWFALGTKCYTPWEMAFLEENPLVSKYLNDIINDCSVPVFSSIPAVFRIPSGRVSWGRIQIGTQFRITFHGIRISLIIDGVEPVPVPFDPPHIEIRVGADDKDVIPGF